MHLPVNDRESILQNYDLFHDIYRISMINDFCTKGKSKLQTLLIRKEIQTGIYIQLYTFQKKKELQLLIIFNVW